MHREPILACVALLMCISSAVSQQPLPPGNEDQSEPLADEASVDTTQQTEPSEMPSLQKEVKDYSGDLWTRPALTGDWGGVRNELALNGVTLDLELTQIIQGNAHGGRRTTNAFRYSGSVDYTLKLDTARMGLWPAGLLTIRGETQFGRSINRDAGSIMRPNCDALFPVPFDQGKTALSEVYFTASLFGAARPDCREGGSVDAG